MEAIDLIFKFKLGSQVYHRSNLNTKLIILERVYHEISGGGTKKYMCRQVVMGPDGNAISTQTFMLDEIELMPMVQMGTS